MPWRTASILLLTLKNNKHQEQEVLTVQKLVKQLHCPLLLFKKQFALSRQGIVILFRTMNIITDKAFHCLYLLGLNNNNRRLNITLMK